MQKVYYVEYYVECAGDENPAQRSWPTASHTQSHWEGRWDCPPQASASTEWRANTEVVVPQRK